MINQNKVKNGFYNIIDSSDRYLLYLYDWRVIESESSIDNFNNIDIYINFVKKNLKMNIYV